MFLGVDPPSVCHNFNVKMANYPTTQQTNGKRRYYHYYTLEEVRKHTTEDDCWIIENGDIFDVTSFLEKHPGGADIILGHAGHDITDVLVDNFSHVHSKNAYNLLNTYKVGKLDTGNNNFNKKEDADIEYMEKLPTEGYKENLINWNHGLVSQVHKLGVDYMTWVNSPVNRPLRLFDSDFVEFFSKTPWFVVPAVWIPFIIFCSIVSFKELNLSNKWMHERFQNTTFHSLSTLFLFCACFLLGLPTWTLVEYILHRFLFHLEPKGNSPFMITLHFFLHGQHHKVPFDGKRLVFPPVAASVFAIFFLQLLTTILPGGHGRALFAGGMLGYVAYDLLHYYFHHGSPKRGSYLHQLKYYHVLHHFDDHSTGFGISTAFWDYPFSTVNKQYQH